MDVFMEYMIQRKRDTKDKLMIAGIILLAIILTFVLFFVMMVLAANKVNLFSIGLLFVAGLWWGAVKLIGMRSIEWEYILTNSAFDVDKIVAKRGRKRVLSMDFTEAAIVACIEDNEHNQVYRNRDGSGVKVLDFTGSALLGHVYFIDVQVEGERKLVLFQPTSKMLEAIRKFNPRNVFLYE